jgi:hypothetical protein
MINSTAEMRRPRSLPRAIRRGLGRLGLRLRAMGLVRGLGKSALISAALAAVAMATDVAFALPQAARWAFWVTWIATTSVTLLASVVRPLIRRLAWTDLAALAERGEPSLGERLTTAVGLLRHQPHGSAELIAAVVDDASTRAGQVDLTRAISLRGAFAWLMAGGLAALSVITPSVMQSDPFAQIGKRFLFPWADIDRVSRFVIELAPGDKVVASGSDVLTSATVRSRFGEAVSHGEAWLEWTRADGTLDRVRMVADAEAKQGRRAFTTTLPRLSSSLTYRVTIGGDVSPRHHIKVVDWPVVTVLKAHVAPPAYTGRPAAPARDSARIDAWEDSQVTLEFQANRRLEQAEVIWPASDAVAQSPSPAGSSQVVSFKPNVDGTRWSATVVAEASGPFTIKLGDEYALENKPEAPRRVVVHADAPPTLAIEAPADLDETSPEDHLLVGIAARDDVAVASAELHVTIERGSGSTGPASASVAAPLNGLGTPVALGEAVLSFATLALKPGDVITYRVRVTDNRPAPRGPNVAWSPAHSLRIIEHSESLRARQETADREAIRARLEGIKKAAADNRQQTEQLRYQAEIARRGQGVWNETKAKELADREAAAREISEQLQLLSRDLEEHPTFHPLARPARQIAEVENEAARSSLDAARRADDPVKRQAEIEQAGLRLNSVTWKVEELKRKFDDLSRIDEERRRLNLLAQQEDELAARADQAAQAGDRGQFQDLADEQERVRRELDEVLKGSPSLRAQALAAHAREASALAARARALAEQQREEARRMADDGARVAAVKALAAEQRALEDDARRLALRVDEPLAQNSRYRIDVNALARSGDAIEQGDIEQARDRASEAESALNRLARDVEDVRRDPKALARRLAQRQEVLRNETAEAVRPSREHPPQTPEGKAALTDRLRPLFERQEAIARLAAMIPVPQNQEDRARDAATKTARARDDLRDPRPKDVEGHQNEARDALNRLAEALPDANQRRDRARQKLGEARSRYEEIARDLEKHLRETAPKPGQSNDPVRAAAELAERIKPLASKEREVAEMIAAINPEPRATPQRDRAERRAHELANALETLRQQAPLAVPLETKPDEPRPLAAWQLLGPFPFDAPAPFAIDKAIDLSAKHPDLKGQPTSWKPSSPVDVQGTIDLGQIYGRQDRLSAFGYSEVSSPDARTARMLIGSDDTLTVWLNGKTVYDYRGSRSHGPATDRVEVTLVKGINRIVVKCGNINGDWKFSLAVTPPPEIYRPITDWRVIGPFASANKPPFTTDGPVDLSKKHDNQKGQPASWQAVQPANDKGAIDLAKHYSTRDNGVAAFGYAELKSPTVRQARMLVGSNDTFTVWLNGKQVYDSQVGRSWAPDHARIDVPLAEGTNRVLVKCGNTGGNWMYSVAFSDDGTRPAENAAAELAHAQPSFETLREALPAVQIAAKTAIDRLQQKLDGQTPADDLAAALAGDERNVKEAETKPAPGDAQARAELSANQRRIANALASLEAPDAPLAQTEAIRRATEAAQALEAPANDKDAAKTRETVARAAEAASTLARRLADEQSLSERVHELATAQRALAGPRAEDDPADHARQEHQIAGELAQLPVENKGEAAHLVATAAVLSDQAARLDSGPRPDAAALAMARERAARALERLAAATDPAPATADHGTADRKEARAFDDPALGVTPAEEADAAKLAERQRHIREAVQAILGESSRVQQALRERSTALGREVADLRDRASAISPRAQWPAHAAADSLGRAAPESMDRATASMQQGRPRHALGYQRQAADHAEQGARHIEDLAAAFHADRPPGVSEANPDGLAAAQAAARSAGQHLAEARAAAQSPAAASQAARAAAAMHQAAQGLRAADQSARGSSKIRGPATKSNGAQGALADQGSPDLDGLKAAVRAKTGRTWGELPGHLRTEILQMSEGRYRDDYARLIELYFREIATDAADRGGRP